MSIFGPESIEAAARVAYPDAFAFIGTLREPTTRQSYIDDVNSRTAGILAAAERMVDREALVQEYRSQFGGGIVQFDSAYFDALWRGESGAEACAQGVDALLRAFVTALFSTEDPPSGDHRTL